MFYALSVDEVEFYRDKVNLFIALAPVTRVFNMKSPMIKSMVPFYDIVDWWNVMVGWYQFFGEPEWNDAYKAFCRFTPRLCYWSERLTYTNNASLDNFERFQVLMAHQPAGVGLKNLFHFAQAVRSE